MHLSLRQLSTFREVMRSGSISQTARAVGRTQPAISTLIQTLEDQLGFALFLRSHGKLTPTPEAYFFLEECEDILGRVERTERTLERINSLQSESSKSHATLLHRALSSRIFQFKTLKDIKW